MPYALRASCLSGTALVAKRRKTAIRAAQAVTLETAYRALARGSTATSGVLLSTVERGDAEPGEERGGG